MGLKRCFRKGLLRWQNFYCPEQEGKKLTFPASETLGCREKTAKTLRDLCETVVLNFSGGQAEADTYAVDILLAIFPPKWRRTYVN